MVPYGAMPVVNSARAAAGPRSSAGDWAIRGFHVSRFERDVGLSTHFSDVGRPSQLTMLFRPASAAAYLLEDMADYTVGLKQITGSPGYPGRRRAPARAGSSFL
jgi:hypothetical protein